MSGTVVTRVALHSAIVGLGETVAKHRAVGNTGLASDIAINGLRIIGALIEPPPVEPASLSAAVTPPPPAIEPGTARVADAAPSSEGGATNEPAPSVPVLAQAVRQPKPGPHHTRNPGRAGGVWTPEREAELRRVWCDGATAAETLAAVNAIPAPHPVASKRAIYNKVTALRLERPEEVRAQLLKRAGRLGAERAAQMAAPAEPTAAEQAAIADAAVATKQDRARASLRSALRKHWGNPSVQVTSAISNRHGLPLREVMRLLGEVRREGSAAA